MRVKRVISEAGEKEFARVKCISVVFIDKLTRPILKSRKFFVEMKFLQCKKFVLQKGDELL